MATLSHLKALQDRHDALDAKIRKEIAAAGCDDLEIARMKKEKLFLQDAIHGMDEGERAAL